MAADAAAASGDAGMRLALRRRNVLAREQPPDTSTFAKLDGSIKKNTSLIKKIKAGITAAQSAALQMEVAGLKLEKYIEEAAMSFADAPPLKSAADVWATVELISSIHQRHPDFSPLVVEGILKSLGPPPQPSSGQSSSTEQREREEATRVSRQRSSLRLLTELYLVGIAVDPPKTKGGLVPNILLDLLGKDKAYSNLTIAVTFAKYFGCFFLDRRQVANASAQPGDAGETGATGETETSAQPAIPDNILDEIAPPSIRRAATQLFDAYYERLKTHLVREHRHVRRLEKSNSDLFVARGEVVDERQESYEKLVKTYERLRSSAESISACLHLPMPELPDEDSTTRMGISIGITDGKSSFNTDFDSKSGLWPDEETMNFYESIIDLQNQVPLIVLGSRTKPPRDSQTTPAAGDAVPGSTESVDASLADDATPSETTSPDDASPSAGKSLLSDPEPDDKFDIASSKATLDSILSNLPYALSRSAIDKLAINFALQNSKSARRKLVKTLLAVPRQRVDILPYYSRLVATLNPYMPDIGTTMVEELGSSFRYHQRKGDMFFVEEKLKNIRFIGELTKFRIMPHFAVLHCIKVLLDDLNHHNIEILSSLLETCGRFLFRSPETNTRMVGFLDVLQRKKNVQNLDGRYTSLIDSAVYECNPPELPPIVKKQREPIVMFLRKLIYNDLDRASSPKITNFIFMADWADPLVRRTLEKLFIKIWKVRYTNIITMARMLVDIARVHPDFCVTVVDAVIEGIRAGLESNIFKQNQRRIAVVRYLGELFNAHVVGIGTVFDTLYLLLRFGYPGGMPRPGVFCPLDIPTDFFRLRLACALLDTVGHGIARNRFKDPAARTAANSMIDNYLVFMQVYLFSKAPMPMDAEFFLLETLEPLRPDFRLVGSYEEAVRLFHAIAETERKKAEEAAASIAAAAAAATADLAASASRPELGSDPSISDAVRVDDGSVSANLDTVDGVPDANEHFSGDNGDDVDDTDDDDEEDDDDNDDDEDDDNQYGQEDEEDEEVVVHMTEPAQTEEDLEFDREFNKIMQESIESRRSERKNVVFDAPVPMRRGTDTTDTHEDEDPDQDDTTNISENGRVKFTLLTKRGNKKRMQSMVLPSDNLFAINMALKQQAEQQEKSHLKELVLNYEERGRITDIQNALFGYDDYDLETNSNPSKPTSSGRFIHHAWNRRRGRRYRPG